MKKLATALVALVAIEHLYILVLEMFLWTKPAGLRAFALTPEFAEQTAALVVTLLARRGVSASL
jgi:putative membrane protein